MPLHFRAVLCSALGLGLVLAACSESTGPVGTLSDPTATSAHAAALDSALSAPVVASFQSLGSQIQVSPSVTYATGAIKSLAAGGQDHYVALANQSQALRQAVPSFAELSAGGIFPDSLLGSVYAWNTDSGRYTRSAPTGGPANGVRFQLYATAAGADHPSLPLVQIGYADLKDESAGGTTILHIVVKNNAGTATFLDYTFSGTGNSSAFTASVVGTVTNGLAGSANKTLTFNIGVTGSSTSITLTVNITLNNPAVTVQETVTVTDSPTAVTLAVTFTFTRPGETVRLVGSVAILHADGSATFNVTVTVNGGTYCTVTGATHQPLITRAGGGQVTGAELAALGYLLVAAADVSEQVTGILEPAQRIVGF
jgi:hypothetical protein